MWSKDITAFICGLISSDGSVSKKTTKGPHITIISTIDKKRGQEVRTILRRKGIKTTFPKGGRSPFSKKQKYVVFLSARNGQWQMLLASIEYWKMKSWIGKRKYTLLKELVYGHVFRFPPWHHKP